MSNIARRITALGSVSLSTLFIIFTVGSPVHAIVFEGEGHEKGRIFWSLGQGCWFSGQLNSEFIPEDEKYECDGIGEKGYLAGHMLDDTNGAENYKLTTSGDYCSYYGLGDILTEPIEANYLLLGSNHPEPLSSYQEGDKYGSVCAVDGELSGQEIQNNAPGNTCSVSCGMQHYVSLAGRGGADRPWSAYFGEPELIVQNSTQTLIFKPVEGAGWGYICPILKDNVTGNIIELCFEEWRGSANGTEWQQERVSECKSPSGLGHNVDRVVTLFEPGTQFATEGLPPYFDYEHWLKSTNNTETVSEGEKHFAAAITTTNLVNVVKADNTACGRNSSTTPSEWSLIGAMQGIEALSAPKGIQITARSYGLSLHTILNSLPPEVSGASVTEITAEDATVKGTVNPYGFLTYPFVVYQVGSPPNEELGNQGMTIGRSGISPSPVSVHLSGLRPNKRYKYFISAWHENDLGQWFQRVNGLEQEFTTAPSAPKVVTGSASPIGLTSATLNGIVNPNSETVTECKFEYGATESYGKTATCSPSPGSGENAVAVSASVTGLSEHTTYHFRIVAVNATGTGRSTDQTFTTRPWPPTAVAEGASSVGLISVTLNAKVNPNSGTVTECKFEYGATESYGKTAPCFPSPGSGESAVAVSASVTGLSEHTTYHFRIVATNSVGTDRGSDNTFETYPYAPSVVTEAASVVRESSATLNATVNPNDANVGTCKFEYGTTISYGSTVSCSSSPGSGISPVAVSAALSGLSKDTTYHFRIVATNSVGTSTAADGKFMTLGCLTHISGSGESVQSVAQSSVWAPISEGCASYSAGGYGLEAFGVGTKTLAAKTAFVGTDDPPSGSFSEGQLKEMEEAAKGKSSEAQDIVIPVAETSIAIIVNPPANCVLYKNHIKNADLQKIWNGEITQWSGISTKEEEVPFACARPIERVVRKDAAGVTYQFKHYLYEINKSALTCMPGTTWTALQAQPTHNLEWPESCSEHTLSQVVHAANSGGGGETEEVRAKEGSIGYAALPDARAKYNGESGNHYHWLKVENEYTGTFNYPGTSSEEPSGMAEEANCQKTNYPNKPTTPAPDANWSEVYGGHPGGGPVRNTYYPICTLTWDVGLEKYTQAGLTSEEGASARAYLKYLVSKEGQEVLKNHDYGQVEEVVGTYSSRAAELVSSR